MSLEKNLEGFIPGKKILVKLVSAESENLSEIQKVPVESDPLAGELHESLEKIKGKYPGEWKMETPPKEGSEQAEALIKSVPEIKPPNEGIKSEVPPIPETLPIIEKEKTIEATKVESTKVEKKTPEEQEIIQKKQDYINIYRRWSGLSKKEKVEDEQKPIFSVKDAADKAYKEYREAVVLAAKKEYGEQVAKGKELDPTRNWEAEMKAEIFKKYIIDEESALNKEKVEGWPPKKEGSFRKVMEMLGKIPKPIRWAVSATIATGFALGTGAVVGVPIAAALLGIKFGRAALSSFLVVGTERLGSLGVKALVSKYEKKRIGELTGAGDFLADIEVAREKYQKIMEDVRRRENRLNIGKWALAIAVGGSSMIWGGAIEHGLGLRAGDITNIAHEPQFEGFGKEPIAVEPPEGPIDVTPPVAPQTSPVIEGGRTAGIAPKHEYGTVWEPKIGKGASEPFKIPDESAPGSSHVVEGGRGISKLEPGAGRQEVPIGIEEQKHIEELATIKKGEGVWNPVRRQFADLVERKQNLERLGLTPADLDDVEKVRSAINKATYKFLVENKYINPDNVEEIRVSTKGIGEKIFIDEKFGSVKIPSEKLYGWHPEMKPEISKVATLETEFPTVPRDLPTGLPSEKIFNNIVMTSAVEKPTLPSEQWVNDHEEIFKKTLRTLSRQSERSFGKSPLLDQEHVLKAHEGFDRDITRFREYLKAQQQDGWKSPDRMKLVNELQKKLLDLENAHEHAQKVYEQTITKTGLSMREYNSMVRGGELRVRDILEAYNEKTIDPKFLKFGKFIAKYMKSVAKHLPPGMTANEFVQKVAEKSR